MRRNVYNIPITSDVGGEGVGIGGEGLGIDGEGVGIPVGGSGESIVPDGFMFYSMQLDRVVYYLTCSNGDYLESVNSRNLTAYNV